jgi:hypothetical protein
LEAERYFLARENDGVEAAGRAILDGTWPVSRRAQVIADRSGTTVQAVRRWRKDKLFRAHFFAELLGDARRARHKPDQQRIIRDSQDGKAMIGYLHANWPKEGFVVSPINGRRYRSPRSYARHLKANGCIPADWVGEPQP